MTTQVEFALHSDDEELSALTPKVEDDPVMFWRLAIFCCQMQLEKAIRARAIRDHYDAIHMRARATREARRTALDGTE